MAGGLKRLREKRRAHAARNAEAQAQGRGETRVDDRQLAIPKVGTNGGDRMEKADRPDKNNRPRDRADKSDRQDKGDRQDRSDRVEQNVSISAGSMPRPVGIVPVAPTGAAVADSNDALPMSAAPASPLE